MGEEKIQGSGHFIAICIIEKGHAHGEIFPVRMSFFERLDGRRKKPDEVTVPERGVDCI